MVDPSTRSLVRAVRASLRLANHSAVRLSTSELLAIRAGLQETLVCIDGQIRENQTLAADSEDGDHANPTDSEDSDHGNSSDDQMLFDEDDEDDGNGSDPLAVPAPYPLTLPPGQEPADNYYVVDRGRKVGIFADNALSTNAVTGVRGGHQTRIKSWHDAAVMYNSLWHKGLIVRVRH